MKSALARARTVAEWAKLAGVSRWTMYRHLRAAGIISRKPPGERAWIRVSEAAMRRLHPDWFEDTRDAAERLAELEGVLELARQIVAAIVEGPAYADAPKSRPRLRALPQAALTPRAA